MSYPRMRRRRRKIPSQDDQTGRRAASRRRRHSNPIGGIPPSRRTEDTWCNCPCSGILASIQGPRSWWLSRRRRWVCRRWMAEWAKPCRSPARRSRVQSSRQSIHVRYPTADIWTTWTSGPNRRTRPGENSTFADSPRPARSCPIQFKRR